MTTAPLNPDELEALDPCLKDLTTEQVRAIVKHILPVIVEKVEHVVVQVEQRFYSQAMELVAELLVRSQHASQVLSSKAFVEAAVIVAGKFGLPADMVAEKFSDQTMKPTT